MNSTFEVQTHPDSSVCHFKCFIDIAVVKQHPNLNKIIQHYFYFALLVTWEILIFTVSINVTCCKKTVHCHCVNMRPYQPHAMSPVYTASGWRHYLFTISRKFLTRICFTPQAFRPVTNKLHAPARQITLLPHASAVLFDDHTLGQAGQ